MVLCWRQIPHSSFFLPLCFCFGFSSHRFFVSLPSFYMSPSVILSFFDDCSFISFFLVPPSFFFFFPSGFLFPSSRKEDLLPLVPLYARFPCRTIFRVFLHDVPFPLAIFYPLAQNLCYLFPLVIFVSPSNYDNFYAFPLSISFLLFF